MRGTGDDVGRVVLVGVDGSTTSAKAVERAVREAACRAASLHVVHVVHVGFGPDGGERGACVLDAAADRAARVDRHVRVRTTLRSGPPVAVLLDAAREADVVVVGTRRLGARRAPDAAVACGSVSTDVAAGAGVPVVVVPPVEDRRRRTSDVVVGVDGSAAADAALAFALDEARATGGGVVVVCAARSAPDGARTVRAALDRVGAASHGAVAVRPLVVGRRPQTALRELGADAALTVVGTRGRRGPAGVVLGPVSQDVLRHAPGPVAVVHAGSR